MSMCLWVRAMDTYSKVIRIVEPKREVLRIAQKALDVMNEKLGSKQAQLRGIEGKVDNLQVSLESTQSELKSLQDQAELTQKRLERAQQLTNALGEESGRWKMTADELGEKMQLLVGDVFLSAACISYQVGAISPSPSLCLLLGFHRPFLLDSHSDFCLTTLIQGAFTGPFRQKLLSGWIEGCKKRGIPTSNGFSLQSTLASPLSIREWAAQGLPSDSLSIDNAILVTLGERWPLMVDPQEQANRWIKAKESRQGLSTIKARDPNSLKILEACVRSGHPILIEDVGESLDPALDTLLLRQTFQQGSRLLIRIGDSDVEYNPSFKLYLTTKLSNPHFLPEVCIKVSLINFSVTIAGLEDQLLGDVVRKERPDLEEAKDRLVLSISSDKRQLLDLENKVLKLLRDSTGNILDDEVLINTLHDSQKTAQQISQRVSEAEETEKQINEAREVYRPVPVRGSILYFVIVDMAQVDPMYQHSLTYFGRLFNHCLDSSPPGRDLHSRLESLLKFTTDYIFRTVCRGFFNGETIPPLHQWYENSLSFHPHPFFCPLQSTDSSFPS